MPKLLPLTLIIASFSLLKVHAQTSRQDSVVKMAYDDARKFRLDRKDFRVFRQNRRNFSSDYFKPAKASVRDTALLKDSTYVKAYRIEAYEQTRHRRTVWHYAWVSETAVGGTYVVLLTAALLSGRNVR